MTLGPEPQTHAAPAEVPPAPFRAAAILVALVVASVILVATTREMAVGRQELAAAENAQARADWPNAILHARAAAEAFVPLSPWPERGERCLESIGHDAETRGDAATALLAYGAARTAALATEAPGSSSARWRSEAEAGLARVVGWDAAATAARASRPREAAQAMLDALARDQMPSTWAFVTLSAAVVALLVSVAWLALGGKGRRRVRLAQSLIAAAVVTYAAVVLTN